MNLENKIEWRVLPLSRGNASWHMAVDHAIFENLAEKAVQGVSISPTLRLYQFKDPAIILGYQQKINGIDMKMLQNISGEYTTRITGGGHVFFTPSEIHFSMITPSAMFSTDIPTSYKQNNIPVAKALGGIGINAVAGRTSVKVDNKTLVVSAQARTRYVTLHHGTILANIDLSRFERILGATPEEKSFLKEITWLSSLDIDYERKLKELYEGIISNVTNSNYRLGKLDKFELALAKRLYKELYTNKDYLNSGKKEAGVCIIAGLMKEYDQYIRDNTHSINLENAV